jgi:single-strand DNA-binding protein
MASDVNTTNFTGRVVASCESRNDGKVAGFSVAINRSVRLEDGTWEDKVDFVDVSAFNGLASRCIKHLRKGDRVTVAGRLSQSTWKTDDGSKRSKLGVVASQIVAEAFYRSTGDDLPTEETAPVAA